MFWLDGDGLERIFPDERARRDGQAWGMAIQRAIAALGFAGAVVVGFSRFATYAIARATRTGVTVLRSDADERTAASAVPLARLDIDPKLRDSLARLGVTTLGQMVRLPGGGILERFGRDAHRLYQLAAGERWDPLVPMAPPEAPDERVVLDDDEHDVERLVFVLKARDRSAARSARGAWPRAHRAARRAHAAARGRRHRAARRLHQARHADARRPRAASASFICG